VTDEPHSTRSWALGAAGEERLAAALAKTPELRLLHDRQVLGTRGNIDHIVIGSAGVFVVDAKAYTGRIEIRDRGGLLHHDFRLTVGRRDCSKLADAMGWQVDAVRTVIGDFEPTPPITPVLCFLGVEWPIFGAPSNFRGVRIESPESLRRLAMSTMRLTVAQADHLLAVLSEALPPK
jgi:hypothetical protein